MNTLGCATASPFVRLFARILILESIQLKRPNILLIMSDEHDPAVTGCYRHPLVQTPNLDRLAAEGVLFENAYCNNPI